MKLATANEVRERGSLQNMGAILSALGFALEDATVQLDEILLQGGFDYAAHEDLFWVDSDMQPLGAGGLGLRLQAGFVDTAAGVTVTSVSNLQDFSSAAPLKAADYTVYAERGAVMLLGNVKAYDKHYIKVSYSAGLHPGTGVDADVYDGVPSWLNKMAIQVALDNYYSRANSGTKPKERHTLPEWFNLLVQRRTRWMPSYISALER